MERKSLLNTKHQRKSRTCNVIRFSLQIKTTSLCSFKDTRRRIISENENRYFLRIDNFCTKHFFFETLSEKVQYLGIFLRSALAFGANQISKSFSTPSKKLGLMLSIELFSAIKTLRNFRSSISFSAKNNPAAFPNLSL